MAMPNAKQTRFPAHARISAPFINCPDCVNGTRKGYLYCDTCAGTGRIYFQYEPDFTTRIREWWQRLPGWEQRMYFGCVFILAASFIAVVIVQVMDR